MKSKLIIRHSLFIILLALVACKEVPPPDLDLIVEDWNGGPVFYSVTVNYSGKNSKVTQKGVCWSDSNDQPTISDNTLYAGDGAEDFAGEIEGLQNNTTYYVRAFSQTKTGTDYSPVVDLMNGRAWMDMGKPTSGDVYQCLSVLSEDEIHLAGDDGVQLKSTDGGNNWEVNDHSVNWDIYNMQFINSNVGFQTTENGRVRKTMDGGITWADYSTDFSEVLEGLFFMDTDIGYVVARSGNVYKSVDGGETWSPNSVSLLGSER